MTVSRVTTGQEPRLLRPTVEVWPEDEYGGGRGQNVRLVVSGRRVAPTPVSRPSGRGRDERRGRAKSGRRGDPRTEPLKKDKDKELSTVGTWKGA